MFAHRISSTAAITSLVLLVAHVQPAQGQEGRGAPPVEDLVAEALEKTPSVAALEARLQAAQEMVEPAAALPDPMVEGMLQNAGATSFTVGKEEMSMAGVQVAQGLLFPGKRSARRSAAEADVAVRQAEVESLRRQVASAIRSLYGRLFAIDYEARSILSGRELLDLLSTTVASRYSAGEAEQEAVVKAQLESSRLAERATDLEAERRAVVAGFNRLLDRPGDAEMGEVADLPAVEVPAGDWQALAISRAPEIGVKEAAVRAAERRLDAARTELKPNFTVAAGAASRRDLDPVVTLRVGIELPLWRRHKQEPMVRAGAQDVEMARHELADARATARSDAARLRAEWDRSESQLVRYREAIAPQASAAIDAARASYLAGRGDFSTVIEDFNLWLDARAELARRQSERFATWAELAALLDLERPAGHAPEVQP
ncbi:MAG: TolC family protein [Acidobacteriota bacterium]